MIEMGPKAKKGIHGWRAVVVAQVEESLLLAWEVSASSKVRE